MFHQLKPDEYHRLRPLFQVMDHHLAVTAIVEGTTRSSIFVDNPLEPGTAVTWAHNRIFLAGSACNPGFNNALKRYWRSLVPADCTVWLLDGELLTLAHLKHRDELVEEMQSAS